jgi:hypothetical protein
VGWGRRIEGRDPAVGQAALAVLRVVVAAPILAFLIMIVAVVMVVAMIAVGIRVLDRAVVVMGQAIVQGHVQARAELEADHPQGGDQAGNCASVPGRKHSDPGHTPARADWIAALRRRQPASDDAPRMVGRRTVGARACLGAIALSLFALPGLHALVHLHEAEHREHGHEHAEHGHEHADHGHEHGHEHAEHGHEHEGAPGHHHHGGRHHSDHESPLEHGAGAPEHLGLALLESDPPPLPRPGHAIDSPAPPAPIERIRTAARIRAHGSRAPPTDTAAHQPI